MGAGKGSNGLAASASASHIGQSNVLRQQALQKSQSTSQVKVQQQLQAGGPQAAHQARAATLEPTNWTLEDSLDFIEGNRSGKPGSGSAVNEKKKAKKERQRLARLEEQQKKEEEERKMKEAEER